MEFFYIFQSLKQAVLSFITSVPFLKFYILTLIFLIDYLAQFIWLFIQVDH